MSMSVINAHDGECEEIELDFAPYRALQSRLHRLLDMASSPEGDECESMGDSSVLEQRDNDEGGGGNLMTRPASFSSTSSSHVGAPSASFVISSESPTDQPTARWYYDETWDATSPPSRIYLNHVEIPIGGSATSLSFGEKECKEAIRSLGRESATRKVDAPRGGCVTFPEYTKCGKGRDVGMQQIHKFESKLAQGAAEQSLSRDVYRMSQHLHFFKLLSFY
ncbi:hypothetical protein PsorP6_005198 [Peronosclerospora sorghi]|uniref:Uncharacterized protein n=1 Tax=Peronosclerospora sorghi TaxID=230839 RepID=A0ACC0W4R9_9STRA|nr:hypothetical protein PsorP6_005198 [Peronosclerospora sorghi]